MERRKRLQCDSCGFENYYWPSEGETGYCARCQHEFHLCDDCEVGFTTRVYKEEGEAPRRVCESCRLAIAAVRKRGLVSPEAVKTRVVERGVSGGSPVKW